MTGDTGSRHPQEPEASGPRGCGQHGFTLIELIAVIVMLGILAAVVVPRYMDMSAKAQDAVYTAAVSEGVSRLNSAYGKYFLDNQTKPTGISTDLAGAAYLSITDSKTSIGDYQIGYSEPTGSPLMVTLTLYSKDGSTVLKYASGTNVTITCPWPS